LKEKPTTRDGKSTAGLRPPTYEQVVTGKIRAKRIGSFNVTRFGSVGEDAYIVLRKEEALQKALAPKRVNEQEFLSFILRKMRKDIVGNGGITDWATFQAQYPTVALKHGDLFDDSKSYKDFFESVTIQLAGEARIFDRDKIGGDLYRAVYGGMTAKRYLRRALEVCGQTHKHVKDKLLPLSEKESYDPAIVDIPGKLLDYREKSVLKVPVNYRFGICSETVKLLVQHLRWREVAGETLTLESWLLDNMVGKPIYGDWIWRFVRRAAKESGLQSFVQSPKKVKWAALSHISSEATSRVR